MHIFLNISFFLILLPAWTHEGRKSGEAYLKGEKKESPWGFPDRERKENGKERGWECVCVCGGGVSGLDRLSQRQGKGGMNINNALCRKIVTMDIIERWREAMGSKFHSWTACRCTRAAFPATPARQSISECGPTRSKHCTHHIQVSALTERCVVVSHSNYPRRLWVSVYDLCGTCQRQPGRSLCFIFPVIAAANLLCVGPNE